MHLWLTLLQMILLLTILGLLGLWLTRFRAQPRLPAHKRPGHHRPGEKQAGLRQ